MSNHKNIIRRELGYQLGLFRINQRKTLHHIAKANGIKPYILDQIEMGMHQNWKRYNQLLEYYNCDLKLVKKQENALL